MTFQRGDVVLVPFPFSDLSTAKERSYPLPGYASSDRSIWVADSNEPQAMKEYALAQGVPEEAIVLDICYWAEYVFDVQEAILVTQYLRLDRALYTCEVLGIDAVGVAADKRPYVAIRYWWLCALILSGRR